MPRIKNDLANHLAASMDARVVKTARLITYEDIGYDPETKTLDEEGVTGETCPMTGKPIWECDCPECTKKMLAPEEGTDEPAEGLSVEEELMRLESMRTQMRKTALEEPPDEHWKIRSGLLEKLNRLKARRTEIEDKLNDPELVAAREKFKSMFPGFPNVDPETRRRAFEAMQDMLAPSIELVDELDVIEDEMNGLEKRLSDIDTAFSQGKPAIKEEPKPVEVKVPPTAIAPEKEPMFMQGLPRPVWGPMVGQAQKAIRALTKISETLDRAGLAKSAYATLRTAQVLQKEIKEG
jgi:hypothetical protein